MVEDASAGPDVKSFLCQAKDVRSYFQMAAWSQCGDLKSKDEWLCCVEAHPWLYAR